MSRVQEIRPYLLPGTNMWAFDDPAVGLEAEPFVRGASEAITRLVERFAIKGAESGFRLLFSDQVLDKWQAQYHWVRTDGDGNVYADPDGVEAWLCPALFKYFDRPPQTLYVRAETLSTDFLPAR